MYFAGIDIGSVSTDFVIINDNEEVISHEVIPTGASYQKASHVSMEGAIKKANISRGEINTIVSTGYGRKNVEYSDKAVTEIRCHAKGAFSIYPQVRTIIDIGGQDCKVIGLDENGGVESFVMNDKCSAGTGRFVEVMARALEVDLEEMGALSLDSEGGKCRISSICTVFAESEVISKLAESVPKEDIINGIHVAIGERILNLTRKVSKDGPVGISGGGGKNIGIVRVIEDLLKVTALTYDNPQIVGALGAALEAKELYQSA